MRIVWAVAVSLLLTTAIFASASLTAGSPASTAAPIAVQAAPQLSVSLPDSQPSGISSSTGGGVFRAPSIDSTDPDCDCLDGWGRPH